MSDEKPMGQVIQIDEARIRDHLGEMVRGTVEETLNAMLDAEADQLCGAGRYERSQARQDTRAGSYDRTLQTSAGEVNLKIPKLRRQTFETAIIERYRRRESSVEESLIEMYLPGFQKRVILPFGSCRPGSFQDLELIYFLPAFQSSDPRELPQRIVSTNDQLAPATCPQRRRRLAYRLTSKHVGWSEVYSAK